MAVRITLTTGEIIEPADKALIQKFAAAGMLADAVEIPEQEVKSPEEIKARGEEAYKQTTADIARKHGDVDLATIFPRTMAGKFSRSIDEAIDNPSLANVGRIPVEAVLTGVGTALDLLSVPGRTIRGMYAGATAPDSMTVPEAMQNTIAKTTGDNIGSSILVDPLTFATMGTPTGRLIDLSAAGIGKAGTKLVSTLNTPTWRTSIGSGLKEASLQGAMSAYDRPVEGYEFAPSVIANTLLGRYGVRGGDVMNKAKEAAYGALTPTPTQIKAKPKLGDIESITPLLDKGILSTGKRNAGGDILANIKKTANDISERQDAIRYGEPTETNVFSSTGGNHMIDGKLGVLYDMSPDEQKAFVLKQPELAEKVRGYIDEGYNEDQALSYVYASLYRSPYKEQLAASGVEKVPHTILDGLKASTLIKSKSNIYDFGTEERRIRENLLSKGGDLYNDLQDLANAGVVEGDMVNKNINTLIDYKRKLSKIADEYGSFDKPTSEQKAKARLYREAVDKVDTYINDVTSPEDLNHLLNLIVMTKKPMTGPIDAKSQIAHLNTAKGELRPIESKRINDFYSTQQEFADILPWRDVVESRAGRLNAARPSLLDAVNAGPTQALKELAMGQLTGSPKTTGMTPRSIQKMYNTGKKSVADGNAPKKTVTMKAVENTARNALAPSMVYETDEYGNPIYAPRGRISWDELWADADRIKKK